MANEIEIKFRVDDLRGLAKKLKAAGFRLVTPSTREINTLYDLPGAVLRNRKELLRLRQYGKSWKLTHKSKSQAARHSSRQELETAVDDGKVMNEILRALGYSPSFVYEKMREEWTDGKGQVVVDHTPIGDFCEIEGKSRWIDATAKKFGVRQEDYITKNYATLFSDWKLENKSLATEMTFKALKH
jgi:adenylate cyclase class 2